MKLLHRQSILTCPELDEAIHQAETDKLMLQILDLPNYDCDILVTFEDDYHKKMNSSLSYESNIHRIFEFIEMQDIKNGVDAFLTSENHLAFRAYGQHYTADGKDSMLTVLVTAKCYDEGMVPIDMSSFFDNPNQDLTKEFFGKE